MCPAGPWLPGIVAGALVWLSGCAGAPVPHSPHFYDVRACEAMADTCRALCRSERRKTDWCDAALEDCLSAIREREDGDRPCRWDDCR